MIPEAKRRALTSALPGPVRFKSGAAVRRDPECPADLLIDYPDGSHQRVNTFAHDQIAQAYAIALAGPPPPAPPPSAPIKRTRSRTDFGECPF